MWFSECAVLMCRLYEIRKKIYASKFKQKHSAMDKQ